MFNVSRNCFLLQFYRSIQRNNVKSVAFNICVHNLKPFPICFRQHSTQNSIRLTKLQKKDGVTDANFELIYRNPTIRYLNLAQISSVVVGTVAVGVLVTSFTMDNFEAGGFGPNNKFQFAFALSALFFTCLSLQRIGRKSPIRIYSDGKRFIVLRNGILGPLSSMIRTEFQAGECGKAPPSKFSLFNDIRYHANGNEYLIFENHFKTNADYLRMLKDN